MRTAARPVRRTGMASRMATWPFSTANSSWWASPSARAACGGGGVEGRRARRHPSSSSGRTSWAPRRAPLPCACGRKSPARPGAPVRLLTACMWPEPQSPGPEAERQPLDHEAEAGRLGRALGLAQDARRGAGPGAGHGAGGGLELRGRVLRPGLAGFLLEKRKHLRHLRRRGRPGGGGWPGRSPPGRGRARHGRRRG